MASTITESRYPLFLTELQLKALTGYLDTVSTSEADPDAEVFALIDQARQVRKQAATASAPQTLSEMPTLTLNADVVAAIAHYWKTLDACTAIEGDESAGEAEKAALWAASEMAAIDLGALIAALAPVSLYKQDATTQNEPA